jgi:hypothetical protein
VSTDVSKKVMIQDYGYDVMITSTCHYEYQSTADVFSFIVQAESDDGLKYNYDFIMSPQIAYLLKEAIEAASRGKMGVYEKKATGSWRTNEI